MRRILFVLLALASVITASAYDEITEKHYRYLYIEAVSLFASSLQPFLFRKSTILFL